MPVITCCLQFNSAWAILSEFRVTIINGELLSQKQNKISEQKKLLDIRHLCLLFVSLSMISQLYFSFQWCCLQNAGPCTCQARNYHETTPYPYYWMFYVCAHVFLCLHLCALLVWRSDDNLGSFLRFLPLSVETWSLTDLELYHIGQASLPKLPGILLFLGVQAYATIQLFM